jgi:hypothetical protein
MVRPEPPKLVVLLGTGLASISHVLEPVYHGSMHWMRDSDAIPVYRAASGPTTATAWHEALVPTTTKGLSRLEFRGLKLRHC